MALDASGLDDPFAGFSQLSPKIWLREPRELADIKSGSPPLTIFLLFWMNASLRHAGKYVTEYLKIAPHARIVCVTTASSDYLSITDTSRRVIPAYNVLRSSEAAGDLAYFHIFSNGGTLTLQQIASRYIKETGKALPLNSIVIDSAPGQTTLSSGYRAFSYALPKQIIPRLLGSCTIWACLIGMWIYGHITRTPPAGVIASRALNNPKMINPKAKRCYIYSETDDLIPWKDVERHASEAEKAGWAVSKEKFEGSPHVGHMRVDPHRYWNAVTLFLSFAMKQ